MTETVPSAEDLNELLLHGPEWARSIKPNDIAKVARTARENNHQDAFAPLITSAVAAQYGPLFDTKNQRLGAAQHFLASFNQMDPIESALGVQMYAMHHAAMECSRRAMIPDQHAESRRYNLAAAGKCSRTFAQLLDTLNKHRGKGQQTVEVRHVHVHSGGQAIVGHVENHPGGGGARRKKKGLPHGQSKTLRSQNEAIAILPTIGDAERAVPLPRGQIDGSAAGESECVEARSIQRGGES